MTVKTPVPPPLPLPSDQDASGRTLGEEEIALLTAAIRSGTLTSTKGEFVKQLEQLVEKSLDPIRIRLFRHCLAQTTYVNIEGRFHKSPAWRDGSGRSNPWNPATAHRVALSLRFKCAEKIAKR